VRKCNETTHNLTLNMRASITSVKLLRDLGYNHAVKRPARDKRPIKPCIYQARMQMTGTIRLLCPCCGTVYLYDIHPSTWRITCKNRECRRIYVISWTVLVPTRATISQRTPPEYVFPATEVGQWKPGDPVGHVREVECVGD
jgi:hypothetical protein